MDDRLQRQIVRQLKILNFWITFFGVVILISLVIMGYFVFKLVTYVQDTSKKVDTFQQQTKENLDVKNKVCQNDSVSDFLDNKTEVCN